MAELFHQAAKDGRLDILRDGNRKQMNQADEDGCTPAMLAAQHGNLEALKTIIGRGGDVDKNDLLGFTAIHHAAQRGHWNCVSYLVNFGVNIWKMDNDYHTAMDLAAMENREDIVKILDMAQTEQLRKSPKVVQGLKEKAVKDAEKNRNVYEKMQDKASKDLDKIRRYQENMNGDVKNTAGAGFFKSLTVRMKGGTTKAKAMNGSSAFSALSGTKSKAALNPSSRQYDYNSTSEFKISDKDESGKRTLRSVKGTVSRSGGQVIYVQNIDIDGTGPSVDSTDSGSRPALTNVFPGLPVKHDMDSEFQSFDSGIDEETPGIFSRPQFGKISFLSQFDHLRQSAADAEEDLENEINQTQTNEDENDENNGKSNRVEPSGRVGLANGKSEEVPWNPDEQLEEDEDDTEYTPVIMFLEGCGLQHYAHLFLEGDVDMDALMRLTNQDFSDMGLPVGPRRKLMDAIQRRRIVLAEPAQMYDSQL
ncbi:ankyrin repeat and SAM domain-containing protein 4B-like [Dreissena polymorpha]|uniref:SAM domain-containing protein n=1 Tax=Dreissena polymorpha TaxID=45954 RepID=A0A9D4MDU5_DREPO|nr:ankyrin repeat and SAM domain-containing protein 4B-like [Dreissena polymorpha]KAH3873356.1 hypothetical protein DPMN_036590 [Dreissena polymorpha]